jgi:hypothetical protein
MKSEALNAGAQCGTLVAHRTIGFSARASAFALPEVDIPGRRAASARAPMPYVTGNAAPGPAHRLYEKLNELLCEAGFNRCAETRCSPYYKAAHFPGRKFLAPGVYFRMHLVGFFEGIESEWGLKWRFADALVSASGLASRREPARLRARMESFAPFLQNRCVPCNMPVYPSAPSGVKCSRAIHCSFPLNG